MILQFDLLASVHSESILVYPYSCCLPPVNRYVTYSHVHDVHDVHVHVVWLLLLFFPTPHQSIRYDSIYIYIYIYIFYSIVFFVLCIVYRISLTFFFVFGWLYNPQYRMSTIGSYLLQEVKSKKKKETLTNTSQRDIGTRERETRYL